MRRVPIAAVLAAALLAGCGSSSSGTLSKAAYTKQADAICKKYNAKVKALKTPSGNDPQAIADFFAQGKKLAQQRLAELRALKPPDSLKADVDRAYGLEQQVIDRLDQVSAALTDRNQASYQKLTGELNKLSGEADAIAKKLGLPNCAGSES